MPKKAVLGIGFLIVAASVLAYLPALRAGFVWNDDTYVTENATLDGADGLRLIWTEPKANEQWYPAVFTSFWLEKRLWGLAPLGYHLVNVLLHATAALLLWALLARTGLKGGAWAAALFALHPMCVESIAWVTERKNTLSLVLSLLAMLAQSVFPLAAFVLFVLALLAKTTAVVVPAVLLVLVWFRRGEIRGKDVGRLVPWFAAGIGLAAHTAWLERTVVRATGSEWSLSIVERLVLAGRVLLFYSKKFFVPLDLAFFYERWTIDATSLLQWLPALAAVAALFLAWRFRGRLGRGPLAALLLFGGVLFPAMGFFNVYAMRYSYVADHFAYQAVAVAAASIACGSAVLLERAPRAARLGAAGAAAGVLVLLGVLTSRQARIYEGEETLWKDTLSKNPSCFSCETNYGFYLVNAGRTTEAVAHFEKSLALKKDNVPALLNLARLAEQRGALAEAASRLAAARAIDPNDRAVLINLATVNVKRGKVDEAIALYEEALRGGSAEDYLAHNGLGVALMRQGKAAEAAGHFQEALRLRPDYEYARANLERAMAALGPR